MKFTKGITFFYKTELFAYLACAFYKWNKEIIELNSFAFYVVDVLIPLYTFKSNIIKCLVPHKIYGIKFHLNSISTIIFLCYHARHFFVWARNKQKYFVNTSKFIVSRLFLYFIIIFMKKIAITALKYNHLYCTTLMKIS